MSHVWVVEAKLTFPKSSAEWTPLAGRDVYRVREPAREEARRMFEENQYNHLTSGFISVRYRAAKYVREE
jgi:hypothetical protein